MKDKEKKKRKKIFFGIYFFLVIVGFSVLLTRMWEDRTEQIVVTINAQSGESAELGAKVTVSKVWEDKDSDGRACKGAQYDAIVENHMNMSLINWEIRMILPAEAAIDSSWNGEFINTGGEICFRPDQNMNIYTIKATSSATFGMVLHSDHVLDIEEFVITGNKDAKLVNYGAFYVLLVFLIGGIIGAAWNIAFDLRTKKLELRRMQDEKIILEVLCTLANFIDAKDKNTKGHSVRVADYTVKLAKKMNMSEEEIRHLGYIALMHDCGKMGIEDRVLKKPDKLSEDEQEIIRMHTIYGGKILESMTAIEGIREGALYHHERYDGKGYPEGLKGEEIPLCARIICVADSFDVMNSDRCYRGHLPMEEIVEELKKNSGKQFDPEIVKCMLKLIEEKEIVAL